MCSSAVFWGCSGTLGVSFGMQTVLRGIRGANFNALRAILEPLGAILDLEGSAAEAWALPGTLPPVSTLDFEEIEYLTFFE